MTPMTKQEFLQAENVIMTYAKNQFRDFFRDNGGILKYPFIVPGKAYTKELWDWDSWLTDYALAAVTDEDITEYRKGCILNFLDHVHADGWTPIMITTDREFPPFFNDVVPEGKYTNTHKPCLAQHALFVCETLGDVEWLRPRFADMERYLSFYFEHSVHGETGLYVWQDDAAIGVDNDPCVFSRPYGSTASIYLNSLMYQELRDAATLADKLGLSDKKDFYTAKADALRDAIRTYLWDERDGFYYSADVGLLPKVIPGHTLHTGAPRHWNCLIQRIGVWTGFLSLWNGIATPEQARRIVTEHFRNEKTFCAPFGVRSVSKMETCYAVKVSGNPSCWLGPIWGNANYMTFVGLLKYGFDADAKELCEKTIRLFADDIATTGQMTEYYDPETGKGVNNPGFQSWNLLVCRMLAYYKEHFLAD